MKIIIVTASTTYCPDNYESVISSLVKKHHPHICGLVIVQTPLTQLLYGIMFTFFSGAPRISGQLIKNLVQSRRGALRNICSKYAISCNYVLDCNNENCVNTIRDSQVDLIVNIRSRAIFKKTLLSLPRLGCVNVHHGLLPGQIGLFCDLFAISSNRETGISLHRMTEKIDAGTVLFREVVPGNKNYMQYLANCMEVEKKSISRWLHELIITGSLSEKLGTDDLSERRIVTTTPTFSQIKSMCMKGMKL